VHLAHKQIDGMAELPDFVAALNVNFVIEVAGLADLNPDRAGLKVNPEVVRLIFPNLLRRRAPLAALCSIC